MLLKPKRGRPRLRPDEGKCSIVNCRVSREMRVKLEAAAALTGKALSREVEARLERSFLMDDVAAFLRAELNGHLNNAAPYMLTALEEAVSGWQGQECPPHWVIKARIAILKAKATTD